MQDTLPSLKQWFLAHARLLPWRMEPSPYAVWVSEVMLQQTQVAVVIPYFERWMTRFPTVQSLASAPIDEVIKLWEGLGYYSRARNLHAGAQMVCREFDGVIPQDPETLKRIKGLGPYTIGAIRAFAFKQRATAVDGNVLRVMARHEGIREAIDQPKTVSAIRQRVEELLPQQQPWVISEALIELGATVCMRTPQCSRCPLLSSCTAYREGLTHLLPTKRARPATQVLHRSVAVIEAEGHLLIKRCQEDKIMRDLHEFPYLDAPPQGLSQRAFQKAFSDYLGVNILPITPLETVTHSFTRYRAMLYPLLCHSLGLSPIKNFSWVPIAQSRELAFSSGHRRVLISYLSK